MNKSVARAPCSTDGYSLSHSWTLCVLDHLVECSSSTDFANNCEIVLISNILADQQRPVLA